jgi:hypothetical protein
LLELLWRTLGGGDSWAQLVKKRSCLFGLINSRPSALVAKSERYHALDTYVQTLQTEEYAAKTIDTRRSPGP